MIMSTALLRRKRPKLMELFGHGMPCLVITGTRSRAPTLAHRQLDTDGARRLAPYTDQFDLSNHINQEVVRLTAHERDAVHG